MLSFGSEHWFTKAFKTLLVRFFELFGCVFAAFLIFILHLYSY
jgi:hypothetical protein